MKSEHLLPLMGLLSAAVAGLFAETTIVGFIAPAVLFAIALWRKGAVAAPGLRAINLWGLVGCVAALLVGFTLRVAAPNIVVAGQLASGKAAVSTLRTILWGQDRALDQTSTVLPLSELTGETRGLLDRNLRPDSDGVARTGGYAYAVYTRDAQGKVTRTALEPGKGKTFLAYAWPLVVGATGLRMYCLNEFEDILEADAPQLAPKSGPSKREPAPPAFDACLSPGADFGERPREGVGADGATWRLWKGRQTERARGTPLLRYDPRP